MMQTLHVKTKRRTQLLDITNEVARVVHSSGVKTGICFLYVPHTTGGILINEHADPDVASDAEGTFDRLVPVNPNYKHSEGNTDSHVKTILTGVSQFIFIENGKLLCRIRWPSGPPSLSIFNSAIPKHLDSPIVLKFL